MADEIVVVQGLMKQYKSVTALDGLSLVVRRAEIYGLLGPNGAGKTTAIQILMGILTPSGGDVRVFGSSPFKDRHRLARRMNFSSAYVQLPFNLSVQQNLDIFARLYGTPQRTAKIESLLDSFRLADKAKARTGSLSSGEQTRLNLCKALLNDPELLFLDEPTASLDPDIADLVRTTLQNFQKKTGLTIIYTSHNMAEVEALCDRVLFLHRGKSITEGTPKEVADRFKKDNLEKVFIHLARTGDVTDAQSIP